MGGFVGAVMTVRDLIAVLQEVPQDVQVVTKRSDDPDDVYPVLAVNVYEADDEYPAQVAIL